MLICQKKEIFKGSTLLPKRMLQFLLMMGMVVISKILVIMLMRMGDEDVNRDYNDD